MAMKCGKLNWKVSATKLALLNLATLGLYVYLELRARSLYLLSTCFLQSFSLKISEVCGGAHREKEFENTRNTPRERDAIIILAKIKIPEINDPDIHGCK